MKISRKYVAFPVVLLMLSFAAQASANPLGDKIAGELCYGMNASYTLSTADLAQWTGQEVSGGKIDYKGSDKFISTFYKSSGKDDNATCKMTTIISGRGTCKQAGVTRSLDVLTRAAWGTTGCP